MWRDKNEAPPVTDPANRTTPILNVHTNVKDCQLLHAALSQRGVKTPAQRQGTQLSRDTTNKKMNILPDLCDSFHTRINLSNPPTAPGLINRSSFQESSLQDNSRGPSTKQPTNTRLNVTTPSWNRCLPYCRQQHQRGVLCHLPLVLFVLFFIVVPAATYRSWQGVCIASPGRP